MSMSRLFQRMPVPRLKLNAEVRVLSIVVVLGGPNATVSVRSLTSVRFAPMRTLSQRVASVSMAANTSGIAVVFSVSSCVSPPTMAASDRVKWCFACETDTPEKKVVVVHAHVVGDPRSILAVGLLGGARGSWRSTEVVD